MAASFNVNSESGLKMFDDYHLSRSYITGYQASKDDMVCILTLSVPPPSKYTNVVRWYNHVDALLKLSGVTAADRDVKVDSSAVPEASNSDVTKGKAPAADDEDGDDVEIFGKEIEEVKKAAEERAAKIKAHGKKKESGKSSVLLDAKL